MSSKGPNVFACNLLALLMESNCYRDLVTNLPKSREVHPILLGHYWFSSCILSKASSGVTRVFGAWWQKQWNAPPKSWRGYNANSRIFC